MYHRLFRQVCRFCALFVCISFATGCGRPELKDSEIERASSQENDPGDELSGLAEDLCAEFNLPGMIIGFRQGNHPQHILVAGVTKIDDGRPLRKK